MASCMQRAGATGGLWSVAARSTYAERGPSSTGSCLPRQGNSINVTACGTQALTKVYDAMQRLVCTERCTAHKLCSMGSQARRYWVRAAHNFGTILDLWYAAAHTGNIFQHMVCTTESLARQVTSTRLAQQRCACVAKDSRSKSSHLGLYPVSFVFKCVRQPSPREGI